MFVTTEYIMHCILETRCRVRAFRPCYYGMSHQHTTGACACADTTDRCMFVIIPTSACEAYGALPRRHLRQFITNLCTPSNIDVITSFFDNVYTEMLCIVVALPYAMYTNLPWRYIASRFCQRIHDFFFWDHPSPSQGLGDYDNTPYTYTYVYIYIYV